MNRSDYIKKVMRVLADNDLMPYRPTKESKKVCEEIIAIFKPNIAEDS